MREDADGWMKAECSEYDNHGKNQSWEDITQSNKPADRRIVKLIWVYKKKRNGKLKARLCVQGCTQMPGVDYDQTHCATMRSSSFRLLCAMGAQHSMTMRRWDFAAAYLQGSLLPGEVIYCSPPPGYEYKDPHGNPRVDSRGNPLLCKVVKPIYGMAQSGRRWQRTIFPYFIKQGFTQCDHDSCLFHKRVTRSTPSGPRDEIIIIGCYVDDLFILSTHTDEHSVYTEFTNQLQKDWDVDDEGPVQDLLNVEISRDGPDVLLKQSAYIEKMMTQFAPDARTHLPRNQPPSSPDLAQLVTDALVCTDTIDPALLRRYQSLVGALLYCTTQTRPDCAYAVGMLCRCMAKPTERLYAAALRVLYYLYVHKDVGLRYSPSSTPLSGMSDSDWAVKHSTSGYTFQYMNATVSWASKKQPTVALSSTEAEIVAASEASKEALALRGLLSDLGVNDASPTSLAVDNQSAIAVAYNPEHHNRMKHVARRHFFVRECVENLQIVVPFVRSLDNYADFFTKHLAPKHFFAMRDTIMNVRG